jgi:hypothetical protein
MRTMLAAALIALGMVGGTAYALSEWWTPKNATCPTFDSEDACKDYCRSDPTRCGGEVACTWRTGTKKPQC